jgi:hypothetical protein
MTRSCQQCRMSLSPNEVRCGNCGFMNASEPGGNGPRRGLLSMAGVGFGAPAQPTQSQAGGDGLWVPPEDEPAAAQWGGSAGQAAPTGLYTPPSIPQPVNPGNSARPPMSGGAFHRGSASMNKPPASLSNLIGRDFFQQPVSKMRVMMGVIVLIIIIISGSAIGIIYFAAKSAPKTPTTVPIPTPAVPATFADPFNDNTYGWNLQSVAGKYAVQVGGGNLTLEESNHKLLWEPLPGQRSYDDFKLFVDATLTKGDAGNGYGIYIRGGSDANSDLATYYRFALYGDRGYAIFKGDANADAPTKLVDWTPSTAIQGVGKVNHILITANGSALTLTVNGQELKTINDTSYTKGSVAFFVSNVTDAKPGAQVQFSNFGIYPLKA